MKLFRHLWYMFLSTWRCTTFNSIPIILILLANKKFSIIYSLSICEQKRKIVNRQWAPNVSCHGVMVATGQEMIRENKISSRSRKSQGISLRVRENLSLWKKSGKSEILKLRSVGTFLRTWIMFYWTTSWCYVSNKSLLFAHYILELSIHVHYMWLAKSIMGGEHGCEGCVESISRTKFGNC